MENQAKAEGTGRNIFSTTRTRMKSEQCKLQLKFAHIIIHTFPFNKPSPRNDVFSSLHYENIFQRWSLIKSILAPKSPSILSLLSINFLVHCWEHSTRTRFVHCIYKGLTRKMKKKKERKSSTSLFFTIKTRHRFWCMNDKNFTFHTL